MSAHCGVRNARVPPDVKNVLVRLEMMAAAFRADASVTQIVCRIIGKPGIGPLFAEKRDDGIKGLVVDDGLAAVLARKGGNGDAPCALARNAPVRPLLDHCADAVGGAGRIEAHMGERLSCLLSQARLIHRDKPLVGRAEYDRALAAPTVRIAVGDVDMGNQHATLVKPLDDLGVGFVDLHAGEGAACT